VLRFFDNEATREEFAELQRLLKHSEDARDRYRHLAGLHSLLAPLLIPTMADPPALAPSKGLQIISGDFGPRRFGSG
jgi:hypothetical protein